MIKLLVNAFKQARQEAKAEKIAKMEAKLQAMKGIAIETVAEENEEKINEMVAEIKTVTEKPEAKTSWDGIAKPVSTAQTNLIQKICRNIKISMPDMSEWTSTKASDYIRWLSEQQKELSSGEDWTERQQERLNLYLKIGLLKSLPSTMSKKEASDTIESFQDSFSEWELNHTSKETIFKIWSLQRRIAGIATPKTICINCNTEHFFTIKEKKCECGNVIKNKESFLKQLEKVQTPEMELRLLKKEVSQALIGKMEREISNTSRNNYAIPQERTPESPILNWSDLSVESKENLLFELWETMGRKVNREIVNIDYSKLDSQIEKTIDGLSFNKSNNEINKIIQLLIAKEKGFAIRESKDPKEGNEIIDIREVFEVETNLPDKPEPVKRKGGRPKKQAV